MKKSRLMKSIVIAIVAIVMLGVASSVYAAENNIQVISIGNSTSNETITPTANNTANVTNITSNNTTNNTSNYNVTPVNNTTSELPKTGESDIYIAGALLVVLGIAAIYTYKKVRDYNM